MAGFMKKYDAETYAAMRIMVGLLFLTHGLQKLLDFPVAAPEMPAAIRYVAGTIEYWSESRRIDKAMFFKYYQAILEAIGLVDSTELAETSASYGEISKHAAFGIGKTKGHNDAAHRNRRAVTRS